MHPEPAPFARNHRLSEPNLVTSRVGVCHVITGLNTGGAEMMLWKLISAMEGNGWSSRVLSLRSAGTIGPRIATLGVPVVALGLGGRRMAPLLNAPFRLRSFIRDAQPDLVQGWMYHGNLAATLASAGRSRPVIWNVRTCFDGYDKGKAATSLMIRAGARMSDRPARIIYNSRTSARQHEAIGYSARRTVIIPNGFDTEAFRPSPAYRTILRRRIGVPEDALIVGQVARYHPVKNHVGFLKAAALVIKDRPGLTFVLAGDNVDIRNTALVEQISALGLGERVHLLGRVDDTPALMGGLDVLCSPSSWGEAFPNVLGEAMACGVPCVATEIGDVPWIVGDTGVLAQADTDIALASAIGQVVDLTPGERTELGLRARARIIREFALPAIAAAYAELYMAVIAERGVAA